VAALAPADEHGRHRGRLGFGPNRGPKATPTTPHRWLPGLRAEGGGAACAASSGATCTPPAQPPRHVARGSPARPRAAALLFQALAGELESVELDGTPGWTLAGDTSTPSQPHRGIRLLGYFDAVVVAVSRGERRYPGPAATRGSARRARPATPRCCSSTARSVGCGTSGARVAGAPSPWSRWRVDRDPTPAAGGRGRPGRRGHGATPTLTVGTVTVGPTPDPGPGRPAQTAPPKPAMELYISRSNCGSDCTQHIGTSFASRSHSWQGMGHSLPHGRPDTAVALLSYWPAAVSSQHVPCHVPRA
jgi:hypothetical protein